MLLLVPFPVRRFPVPATLTGVPAVSGPAVMGPFSSEKNSKENPKREEREWAGSACLFHLLREIDKGGDTAHEENPNLWRITNDARGGKQFFAGQSQRSSASSKTLARRTFLFAGPLSSVSSPSPSIDLFPLTLRTRASCCKSREEERYWSPRGD